MVRKSQGTVSRLLWSVPAFIAGAMTVVFLTGGNLFREERTITSLRHGSGVSGHSGASAQVANSPMHIIQAYCSYSGEFEHGHNGMTSVRSILTARENGRTRNRPIVFHIVIDDPVANAIQKGLNYTVPGKSNGAATLMNRWGDVFTYAAESRGMVQFK